MYKQPEYLIILLHCCEFIAMTTSVLYYNKVKRTYWKWFSFYLVYIFIYEISSFYVKFHSNLSISDYLSYIQIPVEFIFFFWLFAYKSLDSKGLFWIAVFVYLGSFLIESRFSNSSFVFKSINNIIGTIVMLVLVILEFLKQIRSDSILFYRENKMFYINIGVIFFYIGSMPFMGLYNYILKVPHIWNN